MSYRITEGERKHFAAIEDTELVIKPDAKNREKLWLILKDNDVLGPEDANNADSKYSAEVSGATIIPLSQLKLNQDVYSNTLFLKDMQWLSETKLDDFGWKFRISGLFHHGDDGNEYLSGLQLIRINDTDYNASGILIPGSFEDREHIVVSGEVLFDKLWKLMVSGNVDVGGDLTVSGDTTFDGQLTVSGLKVEYESRFGGDADFESNLTTSGLTVEHNANIKGNTTLEGTLRVDKKATFDGGVTIQYGDLTLDNADIYGENAYFDSDVDASGNLTASYIQAPLISGTTAISAPLGKFDNLEVTTSTKLSGTTNIGNGGSDALNVNATTTISGNTEISGLTTISGDTTINGNTDINGTLDVTNAASFGNTVDITGILTAEDALFDGPVGITGILTVEDAIHADGPINSSGAINASGILTASGQIIGNSGLDVANTITASGNLHVSGNITTSGTLYVEDSIISDGPVSVDDTLSVSGLITGKDGANISGTTTISGDDIKITGGVNISGNDDTSVEIHNLVQPTEPQDAATKKYVDDNEAKLKNPIQSQVVAGAISVGQTIPEGTTFEEFVRLLLLVVKPTLEGLKITAAPADDYFSGTDYTFTFEPENFVIGGKLVNYEYYVSYDNWNSSELLDKSPTSGSVVANYQGPLSGNFSGKLIITDEIGNAISGVDYFDKFETEDKPIISNLQIVPTSDLIENDSTTIESLTATIDKIGGEGDKISYFNLYLEDILVDSTTYTENYNNTAYSLTFKPGKLLTISDGETLKLKITNDDNLPGETTYEAIGREANKPGLTFSVTQNDNKVIFNATAIKTDYDIDYIEVSDDKGKSWRKVANDWIANPGSDALNDYELETGDTTFSAVAYDIKGNASIQRQETVNYTPEVTEGEPIYAFIISRAHGYTTNTTPGRKNSIIEEEILPNLINSQFTSLNYDGSQELSITNTLENRPHILVFPTSVFNQLGLTTTSFKFQQGGLWSDAAGEIWTTREDGTEIEKDGIKFIIIIYPSAGNLNDTIKWKKF
jgi:hypothetical protein